VPGKGIEKRAAVLEAALDLFVERGFHGAPTSLIAQQAGVGVGTIYRYFPSKEELVHSIYNEVHLRFHKRFSERPQEGSSLKDRLTILLELLLAAFINSPRDFRFLEQYHYSPFADTDRSELPAEEQNILNKLLAEGKDAGALVENATISMVGNVDVYRGELQVVPSKPSISIFN